MSPIYSVLFLLVLLQTCYAPPVKEGIKEHTEDDGKQEPGLENYMEYHRYLSEVVQALESDADFKEKLQKAPEEEIRSGKIADELEFVSHHVRTKLDEIKRVELERLKELVEKKKELLENNIEDPTHKHLDGSNPHTFEIEDLKKLIAKTQQDLAEADKIRKEEFKEYEMQKELEKQKKLNSTNGEERIKLENEFKEQEEKHKKHEKLHEPGHKAQLEEVWQEQDQMQQEFDPKTFFLLHDMDSNGLWDQNEVKALFLKELDKMYQSGAPEDDIRERIEEMERMRETVFKEVDSNRDGFIDFQEFLSQTKREDFKEDNGWNGLDEQKPYTDEELQEYISRHQMNQHQFQQHPPPVQYQGAPPQGQFHQGQVPQNQQQVPQYQQQVPQHQQQVPGHLPDTNNIYSNHPNAIPQNNINPQHLNQEYQGQHNNIQGYQQNQPPNLSYQQQNLQQTNNNLRPPQTQQQMNHASQQGNYQQPPLHNPQGNIQNNQISQQHISPQASVQAPIVKQV